MSKGENGKSRSRADIASQVKVVQTPQRQREHGDAGGQNGQRRWMRCDDASWGMQNRQLAGVLPGTEVGITPSIRNSCNSNKKIGSRERRSARTEATAGWTAGLVHTIDLHR